MPAAPKSSVTKKVGAPKAKGAVRAKSGCYTCRIRRKVGPLHSIADCIFTFSIRNVMSSTTTKATVRPVSASGFNAWALVPNDPTGFEYVLFRPPPHHPNLSHPSQESQTVGELREKIKVFLASQGMIKGHSGSGARPSEQEPPMLRLVDSAGYSSASESPPAQTLSLSSDAGTRHHTSDSRDQAWVMGDQQHYSHIGWW